MRLRRRVAELEERLEALESEEPTEWTTMPSAPDVNINPRSDMWRSALPPLHSEAAVLYDPMGDEPDEWQPGVYL